MKNIRFLSILALLLASISFQFASPVFGDDAIGGTLTDVHKILLEAAGYQSDTPPTVAQQTELLNKALKIIKGVPHVYHGELKAATQSINAALSNLSSGDAAKAKEDIYDANDSIKSIM